MPRGVIQQPCSNVEPEHSLNSPEGEIEAVQVKRGVREVSDSPPGREAAGCRLDRAPARALVRAVNARARVGRPREIPASLNYEEPNPALDFNRSPFYVNDQLRPWDSPDRPLRAGVSSFGIGGTNAHVILEEATRQEESDVSRPWQLLLLSGRTSAALEEMTDNLLAHFKTGADLNLADIAYTLQLGNRCRCLII